MTNRHGRKMLQGALGFALLFVPLGAYAQDTKSPSAVESTDAFAQAYKEADEAVSREQSTHSFFAIGPTIGVPSGVNLNASLYLWRFVLRGSGMFYGSNALGFQGDLGFCFLNYKRIRHSISFVGGYMRREPLFALDPLKSSEKTGVVQDGTYFGATYDLFFHNIFVQGGVGWSASGNLWNPVLIFQAGYLFSFPAS